MDDNKEPPESGEQKHKLTKLIDVFIDSALEAAPQVGKEAAVEIARDVFGLSKKSDLRKGSKALKTSVFLKESVPAVFWLCVILFLFIMSLLIGFKLISLAWRGLGI